MNMLITSFDELLHAARARPDPQRLLMFTNAVLPEASTPEHRDRFVSGAWGPRAW